MSALEIDHVFICVSRGAPEARLLREAGLTAAAPATHPGQGTKNERFFFRNAYLELLWVHDEAEVRSKTVERTRLWERCNWRDTGACPFGVALRRSTPGAAPPFDTWSYRPHYLPGTMSIDIAVSSDNCREPLLFVVPTSEQPIDYPSDRRQPMDHPVGVQVLSGLTISTPDGAAANESLRSLASGNLLSIQQGAYHVALQFDRAKRRQGGFAVGTLSFVPELPLSMD